MLLEVKNGMFAYKKDDCVLKNINFVIDEPCFIGILGPNGAGKSTLLKCLNRIYRLNAGAIFINNENINDMSLRIIAQEIAYVPQHTEAKFPCSVMDMVLMGRIPYRRYNFGKTDLDAALRALEETGLKNYELRDIRYLSGGERQRVYIARALAGNPKIMLMDEPTSSLDIKYQVEILSLMSSFVKRGKLTIVMTIHDLNLASLFCDRIIVLKNGSIWNDGKPQEVITRENIHLVYGVNMFTFDKNGKRYINLEYPYE